MRTFIFDFDGTIGDTAGCIVSTFQLALHNKGVCNVNDADIKKLIGLPLIEMFRELTDLDETGLEEVVQIYRDNFNDFVEGNIRTFPHVQETLKYLYDSGYILTIASSRRHHSLEMLLDILDLKKYITLIISDLDVVEKKPAPEMVLKTLQQTKTQASEALVIGDTIYDIEMGQRAKCTTCGVSYGNNTREQLEKQGANYIIDDFSQILSLV